MREDETVASRTRESYAIGNRYTEPDGRAPNLVALLSFRALDKVGYHHLPPGFVLLEHQAHRSRQADLEDIAVAYAPAPVHSQPCTSNQVCT